MPTRDQAISIEVDGQSIAGTLVSPTTRLPGVLFVHGWGGSQEQYLARAREIAALGCLCLTFDLRGHAQTSSQYDTVSRADNLLDLLAAYDLLASQRGVDPSAVCVVGSSYGGYLAALLSSLRPVRWLALRAPALYKDTDWELPKRQLNKEQDLEAYRRLPVRPEESRALRACADFRGDVLIVESEHDQTVPHRVIDNYREAFMHARSLTYRVMEDADHGLSAQPWQQAYTALLVGWMAEMIHGARAPQLSAPEQARRHAKPQTAHAGGTS